MQRQSGQSVESYENHSSDNWPGATIASNAASESWTEQTVTIPTGATTLQVGVNWNTVTAGEILYVNEVEITKLSTTALPEYQYNLKDHLGNVRTTFTTVVTTDQHTATLEAANLNTEQSQFLRIATAKRVNATIFDKTNGAATGYSERLNGSANEKYGVAKSISVMPGDVINAQVYGKYVDSNTSNWTGALTTLMGQIAPALPRQSYTCLFLIRNSPLSQDNPIALTNRIQNWIASRGDGPLLIRIYSDRTGAGGCIPSARG